jgi:hypothetical protein
MENLQFQQPEFFLDSQSRITNPIQTALGFIKSNLNSQISGIDTQIPQPNSDYLLQIVTDLPKPEYSNFILEPYNSLTFPSNGSDLLDNSKLQKPNSDILGEQTLINSITTNSNNFSLNSLTNYSTFEEIRTAKGLSGFFVQPGLTPEETKVVNIIKNFEAQIRQEFPGITLILGNNNVEKGFLAEKININSADLDLFTKTLIGGDAINSKDVAFGTVPSSEIIFFNVGNLINSIKIVNPNSPETHIRSVIVNELFDLLMLNQNIADRGASQSLSYAINIWLSGGIRPITPEEFINNYKEALNTVPSSIGYLQNSAKTAELLNKSIQIIYGVDVGLVANGGVIIPTKFIKGFSNFAGANYSGTNEQDYIIFSGNVSEINSLRQSDTLIVASTAPVVNVNSAKGLDKIYLIPQEGQIINVDGGQGVDILTIIAPNGSGLYTINVRNCEQIIIIGGSGIINRL